MQEIQFCPLCNNLFEFQLPTEEINKLLMVCSSCNYTKAVDEATCIKASSTFSSSSEVKLVPDMRYDNTLPHTDGIKCLNQKCPSVTDPDIMLL